MAAFRTDHHSSLIAEPLFSAPTVQRGHDVNSRPGLTGAAIVSACISAHKYANCQHPLFGM